MKKPTLWYSLRRWHAPIARSCLLAGAVIVSIGLTACATQPLDHRPSQQGATGETRPEARGIEIKNGKIAFREAATDSAVDRPMSPTEKELVAKAQQRWDAMLGGDIPKAYAMLSPGARRVRTLETFSSAVRAGTWKSARALRADCSEGDVCRVTVSVVLKVSLRGVGMVDHASSLQEEWQRIDGQWYFVPKHLP